MTRDTVHAQTVAFAAWILTHIFLVFNTRSMTLPLLKLGVFTNKVMDTWAVVAIAMLIIVTAVPFLQPLIKTTSLSLMDWLLVVVASFARLPGLKSQNWCGSTIKNSIMRRISLVPRYNT